MKNREATSVSACRGWAHSVVTYGKTKEQRLNIRASANPILAERYSSMAKQNMTREVSAIIKEFVSMLTKTYGDAESTSASS